MSERALRALGPRHAQARAGSSVPLWVRRDDFLLALPAPAAARAAGARFLEACETWVVAAFELATPAVRLAELPDWTALIDRHSAVDLLESTDGGARILWSQARPASAEPRECAFRLGVLQTLLGAEPGARVRVEHDRCAARGADRCSYTVVGLAARPDERHARMLFESTVLAGTREAYEERRRGLAPVPASSHSESEARAVERFMHLIEDAVVVVDWSLRIREANDPALRLSRMSLAELRGLSARQLLSGSSIQRAFGSVGELIESGGLRGLQMEVRTREGWVPMEVSCRVSPDRGRIVCIARDVGPRLELERELESRGRELAAQNERIRQADLLKSEFLANVSHELATPLTCIQGFARLLRRDLEEHRSGAGARLGPEQRLEFLGVLQAEADRMRNLIEDLLELSKIESGAATLDRTGVSLNRIVEDASRGVAPRLVELGIQLQTSLDPEIPETLLDPERMRRVVQSLLDNGIKFSERGARIELRTRRIRGVVELAVSNPSSGLQPGQLGRIFERFVQADGSFRRPQGGVGLGLNLVRAIVDLHGGEAFAELLPGGRVEFSVRLPATPAPTP